MVSWPLGLLALVGCGLFLFQFLKTLHLLRLKKFIDATQVLAYAAVPKLIHLAYQAVEEVAVVAHHDEGAVEVLQCLLQHVFGTEVEVVGRLVEDQQVDRFQQKLQDSQTGALATGEHLHLLRGVLSTKHKGAQKIAYLVAHLALGHVVYGLEDRELAVEQRGLVLGEIADLHVVAEL